MSSATVSGVSSGPAAWRSENSSETRSRAWKASPRQSVVVRPRPPRAATRVAVAEAEPLAVAVLRYAIAGVIMIAIAVAVSLLTAPKLSRVMDLTPSIARLASLE